VSSIFAWLAVLALPAALAFLGSRFPGALVHSGDSAPHRLVVYGMTGALVLHLLLTGLDALGLPWHPLLVIALLALLGALGHWLGRGRPRPAAPAIRETGWGDAVALPALLVFALSAVTLWTMTPDFVYHWGLKGARFFLHRGVDYAWLAHPWNWAVHPDYPNLLPELFAVSALLAGGFEPSAQMLWTVVFFAMMLASAREALRSADRWTRQAALAILGLTSALFGMGQLMAGAADWMIAAAFLAAMPALLRRPDTTGDWQVAVAAAFAAASKIEGAPFAVILVTAQLVRRIVAERRLDWRSALRLGLPSALVGIPWLLRIFHHGLFLGSNSGPFEIGRARVILPALAEALASPAWHGLSLAVLLGPVLLLVRRVRPVAAVATLQLLFYLYVYFTAPVETRYYVLTSFSRLIFHLIPALLVAGALASPPLPRGAGEGPG
jgi:hypothetical protein